MEFWGAYSPTAQKWTLVEGVEAIAKSLPNGQTPAEQPRLGSYGPGTVVERDRSFEGPGGVRDGLARGEEFARVEGGGGLPEDQERTSRVAIESAGSKS